MALMIALPVGTYDYVFTSSDTLMGLKKIDRNTTLPKITES